MRTFRLASRGFALLIAGALLVASVTAFAGEREQFEVVVRHSYQPVSKKYAGGGAVGAIVLTQTSPYPAEYINCYVSEYSFGDETWRMGVCGGRDKKSVTFSCASRDDQLLDTILGINAQSAIAVEWNQDGVCTMLQVRQSSTIGPWPGHTP